MRSEENMKKKLKWVCLGILIMLCMFYTGHTVSAKTTERMNVELDLSEFDDPNVIDNYLKNHIAKTGLEYSKIKIIDKTIVERELYVEYVAEFTYMDGTHALGTTITIPGHKKGTELKLQIEESLKAKHDRIDKIIEIEQVEAQSIVYDVEYQYSGSKKNETTKPDTTSQSKTDLNIPSAYLCKGEKLKLSLKNAPKKIEKMVWKSDDPKIAKVSKTGKVTGVNYGSTWITLIVTANGKSEYYYSYITVYKLNGFENGEAELTLYRGEGFIELENVSVGLDIKGAEYSLEEYAIPYNRVKVNISSTGENLAKIVPITTIGRDGITYLSGFFIETYRDGVVTITVSDKKNSCKMDLVIGTGISRLDPVDAVKKNDFTGYEGTELKTLQTVRTFFDQYDMYSESMPTTKKIEHIVDYFIRTYKNEAYFAYKHGTLYRTMIDGHGVCGDYVETLSFLLDCLDIENKQFGGIAGEAHAWNQVKVDGKWYYLDAFWCANLRSKDIYFLTEELWIDHIQLYEVEDNEWDIPYINSLW